MGWILNPEVTPRAAGWTISICSLLMLSMVSLAWTPILRYPPGAIIRPMLPIMVTGFVLLGSGRLIWETVTLRRLPWRTRWMILLWPLLSANAAVAWPIAIRAFLNIDMSG